MDGAFISSAAAVVYYIMEQELGFVAACFTFMTAVNGRRRARALQHLSFSLSCCYYYFCVSGCMAQLMKSYDAKSKHNRKGESQQQYAPRSALRNSLHKTF